MRLTLDLICSCGAPFVTGSADFAGHAQAAVRMNPCGDMAVTMNRGALSARLSLICTGCTTPAELQFRMDGDQMRAELIAKPLAGVGGGAHEHEPHLN